MQKKLIVLSILFLLSGINCSNPPASVNGRANSPGNPPKQFLTFSFLQKNNSALNSNVTGSVNNTTKTILVTIKQSDILDLSNLKAAFTFEGSYVMVGKEVQQSTITVNSFVKPLTYRVFAENNTYTDYRVTVQFAMTYPYKPEIYGAGIRGSIVAGETLALDYTYRDRNGDKQKASRIEWQVESEPYSDNFVTEKTEYTSDPELREGTEITEGNASFIVPDKKSCRLRVLLTPKSAQDPDNADLPADILTGYTITTSVNTCIKTGYAAGLVIDEISIGGIENPSNPDYKYKIDEYIVLYNPTDWPIDLTDMTISYRGNGGAWVPYCTFTAGDTGVYKPASRTIDKILPSKQYFIIARETSDVSIKKKADMVLILDDSVDIPDNTGAIGSVCITYDDDVIDLFGYGVTSASDYERQWAMTPAPGEKLVRYNHNDLDNNSRDLILCESTNVVSNWRNLFDDVPYIEITGITYDENLNMYEVKYNYFDWQYNEEGDTVFKWEVQTKEDTDYVSYTPAGNWTFPVNGKTFVMTEDDFDSMPAGKAPYLMVSVTPKSLSGITGATVPVYWQGFPVSGVPYPLASAKAAKLLISRILPTQNIVELYAEKGGTLNSIRIAGIMAKYDSVNLPNQDLPIPRIWKLENRTIFSGDYIRIQTKTTGDADWDGPGMVSFIAQPVLPMTGQQPLIDTINFAAYKGVVFEILEVTSPEGAEDETYITKDTLVIGMNIPGEKAPAIKRYIASQNRKRLAVDKKIEWKTSFETWGELAYPDTLFLKYPDPLTFAYTDIEDGDVDFNPSDSYICSVMVNAANDYVIVSGTNPGNYIMYRPENDSDDLEDFTFDYIRPTEFFLNNFSVVNFNTASFTIIDSELPSIDTTPYTDIENDSGDTLFSVTLNPSSVIMHKYSKKRIIPVLNPVSDATVKDIIWESDSPTIAEVDNQGMVTAVGTGTAVISISITTNAGMKRTADCSITVDNGIVGTKTQIICLNYSGSLVQRDIGNYMGVFPLVEVDYNYARITGYSYLFSRAGIGVHSFPENKLIERNSVIDNNCKSDFDVYDDPDPEYIIARPTS